MADLYKEKIEIEKDAVGEASEKYDELIATLILIATSNASKSEKARLIEKEYQKLRKFNAYFAENQVQSAYKWSAKQTSEEIKALKKKISSAQRREMLNLQKQMEIELNKRLDTYIDNAKKLVLKEELRKLREGQLKFSDATEKQFISTKKLKKDIIFIDSKGRRIANKAIMSVTVGDQMWDVIFSSKRSTLLRWGFRYVRHKSVIDERTTDICLALDGQIRDLTKDKIPPMHKNCRSDVITLPNYQPK